MSILAASGAALGLLCTLWLARSLGSLLPAYSAEALLDPHVDASVLLLAVLLVAGVTVIAGIAPALHASRESFGDALSGNDRSAVGGRRASRLRGALVMAEMSLAVVSLAVRWALLRQLSAHAHRCPRASTPSTSRWAR